MSAAGATSTKFLELLNSPVEVTFFGTFQND